MLFILVDNWSQILISLYSVFCLLFSCLPQFMVGALESLSFLSYCCICIVIVFNRMESLIVKDDFCLCQCQPQLSIQSLDMLTIKLQSSEFKLWSSVSGGGQSYHPECSLEDPKEQQKPQMHLGWAQGSPRCWHGTLLSVCWLEKGTFLGKHWVGDVWFFFSFFPPEEFRNLQSYTFSEPFAMSLTINMQCSLPGALTQHFIQ